MKEIKKARSSTGLKALAVLLALFCSLTLISAVLSACVFYYNGAQYKSAEETEQYTILIREYSETACRLYFCENYPDSITEDNTSTSADISEYTAQLTDSGFYYQLTNDATGEILASNLTDDLASEALTTYFTGQNLSWIYKSVTYSGSRSSETIAELEEDTSTWSMSYIISDEAGISTEFDEVEANFARYTRLFFIMLILAAISAIVLILSIIWLCTSAGHSRKEVGEHTIRLNPFDRIWAGVVVIFWLCVSVCCVAAVLYIIDCTSLIWDLFGGYNTGSSFPIWELALSCAAAGGFGMLETAAFLIMLLSLVRRGKAGALFKSTFIRWAGLKLGTLFRLIRQNLPLAAKAFLFFILYAGITALLVTGVWISRHELLFLIMLVLIHIAVLLGVMYWVLNFRQFRKAAEKLREGDLDTSVNTKHMPSDLKKIGNDLNNISEGLQSAVEKQMRSERFKTELITNVSHDLKTPLTSIINYIDLLKAEDITEVQAQKYLDILSQKSQSLKKLTEDLIEASKASSGAIQISFMTVDLCQLLSQALGEYEEKLREAQLTPVVKTPLQSVYVIADGKHLWRVLDNLLGNCVKYAMPDTRVYIEIYTRDKTSVLEIKNISAQPLDLTAEELMERFVQGDASRSSEGSGLGLNIAQSLTELMQGTFNITIDADLFKAAVSLPNAG